MKGSPFKSNSSVQWKPLYYYRLWFVGPSQIITLMWIYASYHIQVDCKNYLILSHWMKVIVSPFHGSTYLTCHHESPMSYKFHFNKFSIDTNLILFSIIKAMYLYLIKILHVLWKRPISLSKSLNVHSNLYYYVNIPNSPIPNI